ncbi:hypothetical protein QBC35DRAFT_504116 [Podospora australis]|uniref:Transcription factor TFIIIC triple barrel domain-containing protein n=1 Tax=Podospora australis TaxID=1536484 RepID=A0AAN6WNS9_9PEZI|nr:hypothetical protein QBC35DRAFT_504116 [Podospora australis]
MSSTDLSRRPSEEEDQDEWEYEYSTTETETYYLTLDLSVRDFLERRTDDIVHNTRGGYRVWYNPLFNAPEPKPSNQAFTDDKDVDDGEPPEREDRELDNLGLSPPQTSSEPAIDPRLQPEPAKKDVQIQPITDAAAEEIQILELHSEEPMVSYRNHVFRGSWCENIGTEMIFTPHDDKAPLPALRNLQHNIDLIAASSCRVNFTETELLPVDFKEAPLFGTDPEFMGEDLPERYKRNGGVYIHIGGDKSGLRQPQAHFLEDLICLKRKRGEMDEVTIQSVETRHNRLMMADEEEERRRRKLRQDQDRVHKWRDERRKEAEAGLEHDRQYVPMRGSGGRRWPRTRARRAALVRRDTGALSRAAPRGAGEGQDMNEPTPSRWEQLGNSRDKN